MENNNFSIKGQLVDIFERSIYPAEVIVKNNKIHSIIKLDDAPRVFILPGFVDAHVHIESSLLVPSEFAKLAVVHGTVATVSDPHEIANVCGLEGVDYMIENGKSVPLKFYFGAPSCVPATSFETAGANFGLGETEQLLSRPEICYLAEMMNWPGVIHKDEEVMAKLALAKKFGKPIDGHAPGLLGEEADRYAAAGISTDHECFTYEEAQNKIRLGMKVAIREGSAAKNFEALIDLMDKHPDRLMFCSDDKHPDSLLEGHINQLAARALAKGKDIFDVLRAASLNPVQHYGLDVGLLRVGDHADFILVRDLLDFEVEATYIFGQLVYEKGINYIHSENNKIINKFDIGKLSTDEFSCKTKGGSLNVIVAKEGQLMTDWEKIPVRNGGLPDLQNDILKIAVINRYQQAAPSLAYIRGFGIKKGAIASSVAHDSHNIIAVGSSDEALKEAVNAVIETKGGLSAYDGGSLKSLPLPVAGLMSSEDGYEVAKTYMELDKMAKGMGSKLASPFMTLSFMALLVIPELKLSDKGLFDGRKFKFVSVFE
ncbi:adenine deaminase [Pleomorphovibrio marinus]|uniref:adenine deaminase n=1 Tax=Pleomorphovibrio marinus TaxID=2164132 RepID=UPI000E0ABC37|nr:adenine deaminase [Pleomorphovibrio marinus]